MTLVIDASAVAAGAVDDGTDGTWLNHATSDSLAAPHSLMPLPHPAPLALARRHPPRKPSSAARRLLELAWNCSSTAPFVERILGFRQNVTVTTLGGKVRGSLSVLVNPRQTGG